MSVDKGSGGIAGFGIGFGGTVTSVGGADKPPAQDRRVAPSRDGEPAESAERPTFRIVVLSELGPKEDFATGPSLAADPIPVDAHGFDAVMGRIAPTLSIDVTDPFVPSDPKLRVDLCFRDRKAMRPDDLTQTVPVLRALLDARKTVAAVEERRISASQARADLERILPRKSWAQVLVGEVRAVAAPVRIVEDAPPASRRSKDVIDQLLDMVDAPEGADDAPVAAASPAPVAAPLPKSTDRFGSLISTIAMSARAGSSPAHGAVVGSAPQKLEQAFKRILAGILSHPEISRLERVWKGLRLLVERCDTRAGVEVDVIPVGADRVEEALRRLVDQSGTSSRAPVDLLVVDEVIDTVARDMERLERWASYAEGLWAPIVVDGTAAFVGADSLGDIGRSSRMLSASTDPRAMLARSLSAKETSRWITVALNRPLLRVPYTASTSRVREIPFAEDPQSPASYGYGSAALCIAALCARSFVRNEGWASQIVGAYHGVIENLSVREIEVSGERFAVPLEAVASEDAVREVARAGVCMLTAAPNTDSAIATRVPTLYRGPNVTKGADTPASVSLGDQLFVGRLARAVTQLGAAIPQGSPEKTAAHVAELAIVELFARAAPPGPEVTASVSRDQITVTIHPRRFAGVSLEEVTLGAALG